MADLSGAGRQVLSEINASLKEEGLLERDKKFANVDQILDGLERTSGQLAASLRFPPLDVPSLRKDWKELKEAAKTHFSAENTRTHLINRTAARRARCLVAGTIMEG